MYLKEFTKIAKREHHVAAPAPPEMIDVDDVFWARGCRALKKERRLDNQLDAFEGRARAWTSSGEEP
jgi:hypothetical protein